MTLFEPVSDTGQVQIQHCCWICWMLRLGLWQKPLTSAKSEENVQGRVTGVALTFAYLIQRTAVCLCVGECLTVLSFGMLCPYLIVLFK